MKTRAEILCPRTTTLTKDPAVCGVPENRIDRPEQNPEGESGQTLCFVYFQSIIADGVRPVNPCPLKISRGNAGRLPVPRGPYLRAGRSPRRYGRANRLSDRKAAKPIFTISPGRNARLDSSSAGISDSAFPPNAASSREPQR